MKEGTEVFLSSLHEMDRIISEKSKAPEMQDDADMQSLIDSVFQNAINHGGMYSQRRLLTN
jgi:hypothetical protein